MIKSVTVDRTKDPALLVVSWRGFRFFAVFFYTKPDNLISIPVVSKVEIFEISSSRGIRYRGPANQSGTAAVGIPASPVRQSPVSQPDSPFELHTTGTGPDSRYGDSTKPECRYFFFAFKPRDFGCSLRAARD